MFASIVLSTIAIVSVSWSSRVRWMSVKRWNEASSMTALTWPSKSTGRTTMFSGGASPEPGVDPDVIARHVSDQDAVLLVGALADQPLAGAELGPQAAAARGRRRCCVSFSTVGAPSACSIM